MIFTTVIGNVFFQLHTWKNFVFCIPVSAKFGSYIIHAHLCSFREGHISHMIISTP